MKNLILNEIINQGYNQKIFSCEKISLISLVEEASYLALKYKKEKKNIVVIKNSAYDAIKLYEHLCSFLDENERSIFILEESLRVEEIASSPENLASSIESLAKCLKEDVKVVITSVGSMLRYLPNPNYFKDNIIKLKIDDNLRINDLQTLLLKAGYQKTVRVEHPLTFSLRGGIIDVYSINYDKPVRIEFFDTIIESIRFFDVETKRTIEKLTNIELIPASLTLFNDEEKNIINDKIIALETLELRDQLNFDLDYLNDNISDNRLYYYYSLLEDNFTILDYLNNPLLIVDNEEKIIEKTKQLHDETYNFVSEMVEDNKLFYNDNFIADYFKIILNYSKIYNEPLKDYENTKINTIQILKEKLSDLLSKINEDEHKFRIIIVNEKSATNIIDELIKQNITYHLVINEIKEGINIVFEEIKQGFEINNLIVYSSNEILDKKNKVGRFENKYREAVELNDYQDLEINDYIVHNDYGIGRYLGIITKEFNGFHKDYLKIAYANDDELLVPVEQFSLIRKYASKEGLSIKLHSLGSSKWSKTKEKVRENLQVLAKKLVEIYLTRQKDIGFKFASDSEEQKEFENSFDYPLTKDQQLAVDEIKKDMESIQPMDRLLCGDVGFGKTEVAIRASFKAVYNGKQVAFLCPTTVLSMQHYNTYMSRFKNYPVKICVLNRFVSKSEQKLLIEEIKRGQYDIIIGTHRLLSKDIMYHDLGLLIIDEEQRFGVEHKEQIKEIRNNIDVLSLSATPIPRTLQMSLIGMKTLSTINTPPSNRLPVQTYVVEKSLSLIVEVIKRELSRGGQAFYLLNNVQQIYEVRRKLATNLPNVSVKVVHGQMSKEEIEEVMVEFSLNLVQVLICTTIIETGIDIPNANTIIVENAHKFGLSQLYQIRGRVGRSNKLAYAYLMIPKLSQMSEVQESRLKAIKEFTKLGSGYKIAKRDLMIRGAGEILGPVQSGFIDSVGIDLYMDMLIEAIEYEKGNNTKPVKQTKKSNLKLDNYLPKNYAPYDMEKLDIYRNIENIDNLNILNDYKNEIIDLHGKMPKEVENLFIKKQIDISLNLDYIKSIVENQKTVVLTFTKEFSDKIDGIKLFEYCGSINRSINIAYRNMEISLTFILNKKTYKEAIKIIEGRRGYLKDEN